MKQEMITAITDNLNAANVLIQSVTASQFSDNSVGPYHSSIGSHLRHILDVFSCAFEGLDSGHVNLISRERNELAETIPAVASDYLEDILRKLNSTHDLDENLILKVTDDLGNGPITLNYTLAGLLAQAHSHAIHHFACMGYILQQLNIVLPESRFGYNPTTPKHS